MGFGDASSQEDLGSVPPNACVYLEPSPQSAWPVCTRCGKQFQFNRRDEPCGGIMTSPWPIGCTDPESCGDRHRQCMYFGCVHRDRDIKSEIEAEIQRLAMTNDPATQTGAKVNDLPHRLRASTEIMAHVASVPMDVWDKHSNLCLDAADEITRLRAELAAAAEILDTLSRLPSWEFNYKWRTHCAAAAKRAREVSGR